MGAQFSKKKIRERSRNKKQKVMFGLFKKKSEREKLLADYKKLKEQAFILSKTNRSESDRLEKEAHDISLKIDIIDKEKNDDKKD